MDIKQRGDALLWQPPLFPLTCPYAGPRGDGLRVNTDRSLCLWGDNVICSVKELSHPSSTKTHPLRIKHHPPPVPTHPAYTAITVTSVTSTQTLTSQRVCFCAENTNMCAVDLLTLLITGCVNVNECPCHDHGIVGHSLLELSCLLLPDVHGMWIIPQIQTHDLQQKEAEPMKSTNPCFAFFFFIKKRFNVWKYYFFYQNGFSQKSASKWEAKKGN